MVRLLWNECVCSLHTRLISAPRALRPVLDKRAAVVDTLNEALGKNASVRKSEGVWSHDNLSTESLDAAAAECKAFPKSTAEMKELIASAATVTSIRAALLKVVPTTPATWAMLLAALDAVELAEHQALPEIKAAWQEFREARELAVTELKAALK